MKAHRWYPVLAALVLLLAPVRAARAQVGRSCSVFSKCPSGYSCHTSFKCYNSPRQEGQPCSAAFQCGGGLRCVAGSQVCAKASAPPTGIIEKGGAAVMGGATTLGNGVIAGATTVGNGVIAGATTVGNGVIAGATAVGNGVIAGTTAVQGALAPPPAPEGVPRDPPPVEATQEPAPDWIACATEHGTCSFDGRRMVRYGADGKFSYASANGIIACGNEVFGDPVPGVLKSCQVSRQLLPPDAAPPVEAAPAYVAPANVALGKRATQSSTAIGAEASRAVDGNADGNFFAGSVTHTGNAPGEWWMVDLGGQYEISEVIVHNRTDCCATRLNGALYITTTEGWPSTSAVFGSGLGAPGTTMRVPTVSARPVTGRYVYIVLTTPDYLSLAEVEVMGVPRP